MKKNIALYILLFFLIVVNGFFLYKHIGNSYIEHHSQTKKGKKRPTKFLVKELNFNDEQMQQYEALDEEHHQKMKNYLDETKILKDKLFRKITDINTTEQGIDSITNLLGDLEKKREFQNFDNIQRIFKICNEKQKKQFKKIIRDAMHRGRPEKGHPQGHGDRPPPRH